MFSLSDNHFGTPSSFVSLAIEGKTFHPVHTDEEDYDDEEEHQPIGVGVLLPELEPIDVTSSEWTHQEPDNPESPSNFTMSGLRLSPIVVPKTGNTPIQFFNRTPEPKRRFSFETEKSSILSTHGKTQLPSKTLLIPGNHKTAEVKPNKPIKQKVNLAATNTKKPIKKVQKVNLAAPIIKKEPKHHVKVAMEKQSSETMKKCRKDSSSQRRPRQTWKKQVSPDFVYCRMLVDCDAYFHFLSGGRSPFESASTDNCRERCRPFRPESQLGRHGLANETSTHGEAVPRPLAQLPPPWDQKRALD